MEGSRRVQRGPLDIGREFVNSRMEQQILMRVYELVVPVTRLSLPNGPELVSEPVPVDERDLLHQAQGA